MSFARLLPIILIDTYVPPAVTAPATVVNNTGLMMMGIG